MTVLMVDDTSTKPAARSVAGWLGQVLAWIVILAVAGVLVVSVLIPRFGGATPYTILTGSMRPQMPPGTLAVIKPVDTDSLGLGTVVTYQLESGEPAVVTHRIVSVGINGRGERVFTTQGDANESPDVKQVLPVQIKGKLWYDVPYLGYVNSAITGKERHITMIIVVSGLLLYSAYMFGSAFRSRGRRIAS